MKCGKRGEDGGRCQAFCSSSNVKIACCLSFGEEQFARTVTIEIAQPHAPVAPAGAGGHAVRSRGGNPANKSSSCCQAPSRKVQAWRSAFIGDQQRCGALCAHHAKASTGVAMASLLINVD